MLVVPFQTRISVRSAPWVTLALALACLATFFLLQARDDALTATALRTYGESSLPQIEVPRYRQWLQGRSDGDSRERLRQLGPEAGALDKAVLSIQSNPAFLRELRSGAVVRTDEPAYARWREDRLRFEGQFRQSFRERFHLRADSGQPWRLLTYAFLHTDAASLLLNVVVLLLVGAFAESALGAGRFLIAYLLAAAFAGGVHLLLKGTPLVGASGALAATSAMVVVLYGMRSVPALFSAGIVSFTAHVQPLAFISVYVASELVQLWLRPDGTMPYWSIGGGVAAGVLLAWLLRPRDGRRVDRALGTLSGDKRAERRYSLARQAQEAASRMDTRRAVRLYRELVEGNPDHAGYLASYFNMALMAQDPETLADASLRVLWMRNKGAADELRKTYLQMGQPNVLKTLPVDEQLRLSRRLVRTREDSAALKVLDSILTSEHLRNLYGRQIADCLLGLFTTYTRYGLRQQADQVRTRLKTYFPQPTSIGGLAPNTKPPSTIRGTSSNSAGPSTLFIDLSR
jgi:membrane associated rhomboid family serine protease